MLLAVRFWHRVDAMMAQLAQEARDKGTDAAVAASARAPKKELEEALPVQSTASALLRSSDEIVASEGAPSSELTQTFGQLPREATPLPRLRGR
jgi:hypothetical protein